MKKEMSEAVKGKTIREIKECFSGDPTIMFFFTDDTVLTMEFSAYSRTAAWHEANDEELTVELDLRRLNSLEKGITEELNYRRH